VRGGTRGRRWRAPPRRSNPCRPRGDAGPPLQGEVRHEEDVATAHSRVAESQRSTASVAGGAAVNLGAAAHLPGNHHDRRGGRHPLPHPAQGQRPRLRHRCRLCVADPRHRTRGRPPRGGLGAPPAKRAHVGKCRRETARARAPRVARRDRGAPGRRMGLPRLCGPRAWRRPSTRTASSGTGRGATRLPSRWWLRMCRRCSRPRRAG